MPRFSGFRAVLAMMVAVLVGGCAAHAPAPASPPAAPGAGRVVPAPAPGEEELFRVGNSGSVGRSGAGGRSSGGAGGVGSGSVRVRVWDFSSDE